MELQNRCLLGVGDRGSPEREVAPAWYEVGTHVRMVVAQSVENHVRRGGYPREGEPGEQGRTAYLWRKVAAGISEAWVG